MMKYQKIFVGATLLFVLLQICLIKGVIFYWEIPFKVAGAVCAITAFVIIIINKWWAGIFYSIVVLLLSLIIAFKTKEYVYKYTYLKLRNKAYVTVNSKFFDLLPEGNDIIRLVKTKHIFFEEEILRKEGNITNHEKINEYYFNIFLTRRNFFNDRIFMDTIYLREANLFNK